MNAFFNSQFNYCPVVWICHSSALNNKINRLHIVWMCHSRALNNKINRLHERCLRIIYNDKTSTFKELLEKDNSVSIRYGKILALAVV